MKNLLDDPDVYALYLELQSNNSSTNNIKQEQQSKETHYPKIFFDGKEVEEFIGDNDYGF